MKPLTNITLYHLILTTGEEVVAGLVKNDMLAENVYQIGERFIFECEVKEKEFYFIKKAKDRNKINSRNGNSRG